MHNCLTVTDRGATAGGGCSGNIIEMERMHEWHTAVEGHQRASTKMEKCELPAGE
jgi:hypothetical protein